MSSALNPVRFRLTNPPVLDPTPQASNVCHALAAILSRARVHRNLRRGLPSVVDHGTLRLIEASEVP